MRPEERYEHPNAPVRDGSALGPTEDLDREPDGIPHSVLAAIVVATIIVAAMILLLLSGHVPRNGGAVLTLVVGIPALALAIFAAARHWRPPHSTHASR